MTKFLVVDSPFNRVNYRSLINSVVSDPPGYASVLKIAPLTPEEFARIDPKWIDLALENGIKCPYCGGQDYNTTQEVLCARTCSEGKWGDQDEGGDGDTIAITCDHCEDRMIWGEGV